MDEASQPDEKRMRLRYAGSCSICSCALPAKTLAVYNRSDRSVRCLGCEPVGASHPSVAADRDMDAATAVAAGSECELARVVSEPGTAGSSARREYERRKSRREDRVRTAHPKLGGLILALTDDPQSTKAWNQGAVGEERLGIRLDSASAHGVAVLHDRRIPGTKANIDHITVAANGVWVIDAKRYKGRPTLHVEGGILRPRVERLFVGRRDCTKLVDGVLKQMRLVTDALVAEDIATPVHGALAFVDADWPLVGGAFTTRGVHVLWPKKLIQLLKQPGSSDGIATTHAALARRFPPA